MSDSVKYLLDEEHLPTHWYNINADLPEPWRRCCIPAPSSRSPRTTWRRSSRAP
jgi:predicted alternative tryptophan synthase beta-subunit